MNKAKCNYDEIIEMVKSNPVENWNCFVGPDEYVLKKDTDLRIVGENFDERKQFFQTWAVNHPDEHAFELKYTIFYKNSRIKEFYLVGVDGGRSMIPIPELNTNVISRENYLLARAVNEDGRLDEYIGRSRLIVEEAETL